MIFGVCRPDTRWGAEKEDAREQGLSLRLALVTTHRTPRASPVERNTGESLLVWLFPGACLSPVSCSRGLPEGQVETLLCPARR